MVTFEAMIQDKKVRMFADLPLKNAAGAIIKTLAQISQKTDIFNGTFVMCFGWAYFFLDKRQDENGEEYWVVQTTDYQKNPMNDKTDNVTVSLLVQNIQIETVQTAKVQPLAATFKDTVLVLKEAMGAKDVYMNRTEAEKEGDSGWYFGLLDDPNEENHSADEYTVIASYEFLKFRSEALRVLEMPVGTLAVFHENTLTALVDKDDNPLKFTTPPKKEAKETPDSEETISENKE
ncbi:MAG: DUF2185 domain-containing protein [Clostridia bacterium]|nr:DUF2185 domain-containing protein [Clostridia bacterium]